MKRRSALLLSLLLAFAAAFAGNVDENTARRVATAFLHSRMSDAQMVAQELPEALPAIHIGTERTLMYAFNFENGGYVLIAATDAAIPVLGYSFDGNFTPDNQPPALAAWLAGYELQLSDIMDRNLTATPDINASWESLLNYNPGEAVQRDLRSVEPLLPSTWDQGSRYNALCPEDDAGPGGHVYAGCVATAMSQVIYYWRYPLQGTGSHGYYSDYGYLFVDFSQADYDYDQMRNEIGPESNHEMAEIQYHCGVAVDMMYAPDGSGAYSFDAASALREYFGFSNQLSLKQKENYTQAGWADLLMQNLDNGWPMYYSGFGSGGHAFNVDGYQGTDYFHFNWGWSGSYNGYFYLNNLNPGGNNFSYGQGAIVNFYPGSNYPYYCNGVKTLTRHNGTIEDGSGPVDNYTGGLNCGWLIAPADSVTNLTLTFEKFNLTDGLDVLNIFDGPDASYPLLASLTGTALPQAITATGDKLFLEFLTEGDEGSGFRLSYNSDQAVFCSGTTIFNDLSGVITDGSGTRDYNNNSVCKFRVEPENANSITFTFNALDTEPDHDQVKIYNLASQSLVASFSGSEIPESVTIPSGKAMILFNTNSDVTAGGWELSYISDATTVGMATAVSSGGLGVQVYPVPASDWLRVELSSRLPADVLVSLVDLSGRVVVNNIRAGFTGQETVLIPVSDLAEGIYYLKYAAENSVGTHKVLISR
ncbi:C10 family peptidase [Lentimicrobium sp.]|uniref:C10 family peptidase n=1 Tax=Lentimicrobium sp. TaxID=2034841 RepID=UPI002D07D471|nr:C10 family peptidase [Lentimicrobium sp.]HRW69878.1 C10 family peptidase [Lentimicrobium sp.]